MAVSSGVMVAPFCRKGFRVIDGEALGQRNSILGCVAALLDVQSLGPPACPCQAPFEVRGTATDQEESPLQEECFLGLSPLGLCCSPKKVKGGRSPNVLQCDPLRRLEIGAQHTIKYLETHPSAWMWWVGLRQCRKAGLGEIGFRWLPVWPHFGLVFGARRSCSSAAWRSPSSRQNFEAVL